MPFTPENGRCLSLIECVAREDVLTRITGREEIDLPRHVHDRYQIIYILTGTLHIETDTQTYFVTERHWVWIPCGIEHRLSSNNLQIALLTAYFYVDGLSEIPFSVYGTDELFVRNLELISAHPHLNEQLFPELYQFAVSFFRLLPQLCEPVCFPLMQPYILVHDGRLRPVLAYMKAHLTQELTIENVASYFGYSVRNLTRLFTRSGLRFVRYLNYLRVVRAIELLADGKMNVEQTAYFVGFSSPNSFSRVFRQLTGSSPSYFLRKH